jgi:hypothetical protein
MLDLAGIAVRQATNEKWRRLNQKFESLSPFPAFCDRISDDSLVRSGIAQCIDCTNSDDVTLQDIIGVIVYLTDLITETEFEISLSLFPDEFQDFLHLVLLHQSNDILLSFFPLLHALIDRVPEFSPILSQETMTDALFALTRSDNENVQFSSICFLLTLFYGTEAAIDNFDYFGGFFFANPIALPTFPEFALRCIQMDRYFSILNPDFVFEFLVFLIPLFAFRDTVLKIATILSESQRERFVSLASAFDFLLLDSLDSTSISQKIVALRYLKALLECDLPIERCALERLCVKIADCWRTKVGDLARLSWELTRAFAARAAGALDFFIGAGCVDYAIECFESEHRAATKIAAAEVAFQTVAYAPAHPRAACVAAIYDELAQAGVLIVPGEQEGPAVLERWNRAGGRILLPGREVADPDEPIASDGEIPSF